jgi:CBS domain-containing protein
MTKITDVMTKNPVVAVASDTVDKVAKLMRSKDIGPVPIVQDQKNRKLIGIVTDRDLVVKVMAEGLDARNITVEQVMTKNPVSVREGDDLKKVLDVMAHHQIRRVPVVDTDDQIVGIIAQADVATTEDPKTTGKVVEQISKP